METPIWSAVLDHVCLETSSSKTMRSFYRDALGMQETELGRRSWLLEGPERRLVLTKGMSKKLTFSSFQVADDDKMVLLRKHIEAEGYTVIEKSAALFQQKAFELTDPDGNIICFGVGASVSKKLEGVGGRLQHVVVASARLDLMVDFYGRVLGFLPSDYVMKEDGKIVAAFYRSNPEHHSLAVFAAAEKAFDHIAFETPSWNHLRDWADRLAAFDIPIWWGPGRHGAGNNLFFMVLDPDGNKIEFSAELEHIDINQPVRHWPHDRRTLNLWGNARMRI